MLQFLYDLVVNNRDFWAASISIGTIVFSIWKWIINPKIVKPTKKKINDFNKAVDMIEKVLATLGPNGGSSLYDRLVLMDKKMSVHDTRVGILNSAVGIGEFYANSDGATIRVNDVACYLVDRQESEFLGQNWINVVNPEERDDIVKDWFDAIKYQRNFSHKFHWTKPDGTLVPVIVNAKPIRDSVNTFIGMVGTVHEIKNPLQERVTD